ncbi:MAG TPA: shikimate dehydrogenase [Acidimicrobiales bacterium]|nr:shikimate dehydrogenase [Acidimicrobiales bacterium]
MTLHGRLPTATTRFAAVVGDPVRHSLSPELLNTAFQRLELDWTFGAFEVADGSVGDVIGAMRALPLWGLSVTMPHKAAVIPFLDGLSPVAERLGAVNCVAWDSSRLVGHSTDGAGLIDALRDEGFDPHGKRCVVLGAGGAARAAIAALALAGASEVIVVNRTGARAEAACHLAAGRGRVGTAADTSGADLVVNATPMGMTLDATPTMPLDPELLAPGQVLFDMVYDPPLTPIVAAAIERGVHAVTGLGMLVHQAAHAFTLWTGEVAPTTQMAAAATTALGRRVA